MREVAGAPRTLTVTGERGSPGGSLAGGCLLAASPRIEPRASSLCPSGERDGRAGEVSTANRVGRRERQESRQIAFSREYEIRGGGVSR